MTKLDSRGWHLRRGGRLKTLCQPPMDRDIAAWLRTVVNDLVTRRAREIYFERGALPGRDLDNWLLAEAEIKRLLDDTERALNRIAVGNKLKTHERN